ncbi:MAG: KH domain-containing protein [Clostridia bacterium]|nr:KH domain-containing protein [Clostridia bacterium]
MKSIETQGKTVDQAIELGLYKLGKTRDEVKITILEEAGLFNKARVRLSTSETSETEEEVKKLCEELLSKMDLNVKVFVEETENGINVDLGGKDTALAIGKHGDSLEAISHILNNIYNRDKNKDESIRIFVDSNNYRAKREATLVIYAKKMAARATREGHNIKLEPMTSFERRIIHNTLSDSDKVFTESAGMEPNRYVVIKLKNKENRRKDKSEDRKEETAEIENPLTVETRADND